MLANTLALTTPRVSLEPVGIDEAEVWYRFRSDPETVATPTRARSP